MFTIYIPSKGRASKCLTANLLIKSEIDFKIVVEPQDYEAYKEVYGKEMLIMLDENNKGLSHARNFIKEYSNQNKEDYHWQFDDDVKYFQKRIDGKNITINAKEMIDEIEKTVISYTNVGVAGFRDSFFAWTQTKFVSLNKLVCSCFLVKNDVESNWSNGMIEDVDYCIQVLSNTRGYCTLIFNEYLYLKMPDNKASGGQGNYEKYETLQQNLVDKYPLFLRMKHDTKRNVMKLAPSRVWQSFKQQLIPAE